MAGYYSDLVYPVAEGIKPRTGHAVSRFSKDGRQIKDQPLIGMLAGISESKRIGVRLHSRRMEIREATQNLKDKLGRRLFQTGESLYGRWDKQDDDAFKFEIDLRITLDCVDRDDAEKIAKRHWHPDLEPEDFFFTVFADELEMRLERSLMEFDGTIDQRIARYQNSWRTELEDVLSKRFGVRVELRFEVALATPQSIVVTIGGGGDADLRVSFCDRLDSKTRLSATISIEPRVGAISADVTQRFPQTEPEQRALLRGLVRAATQERVKLFDFWFNPKGAAETIRDHVDSRLKEFGRSVSSVTLVPIAKSPVRDEKVEHAYDWKDNLGLRLPIRATGHISITSNGAGIYDREGQPDRQDLFQTWLGEETEKALAGKNIITLDITDIPALEEDIKTRMSKRAEAVGLLVEPFVSEPNLPFRKWQSSSFIHVAAKTGDGRAGYRTAHETIPAEFTIDLEVVFNDRTAFFPFLRPLEPFKDKSSELLEESLKTEIEKRIIEVAQNAATSVMQRVEAENYFGQFARSDDWDAPVVKFHAPGTDFYDDTGGESQITLRIKELLGERYPGVEVRNVVYHRIDSCVKELREFIGKFRTIKHTRNIKDPEDGSWDRTVELVIYVAHGNAKKTVEMLGKNIAAMSPEAYKAEILSGLDIVLDSALTPDRANDEVLYHKLESLIDKLVPGNEIDPDALELRQGMENRIKTVLADQFGLVADKVNIFVRMPEAQEKTREFRQIGTINALEMTHDKITQLSGALKKKREELYALGDTTSVDRAKRDELKKTIEEMERELAEVTAQARGGGEGPVSIQAASTAKALSNRVAGREGAKEDKDLKGLPYQPSDEQSEADGSPSENDDDL